MMMMMMMKKKKKLRHELSIKSLLLIRDADKKDAGHTHRHTNIRPFLYATLLYAVSVTRDVGPRVWNVFFRTFTFLKFPPPRMVSGDGKADVKGAVSMESGGG